MPNLPPAPPGCGVLASGGLDSSILVHRMTYDYERVVPIYVRAGLAWEDEELAALRRFLAADPDDRIEDVVVLDLPMGDLLGDHWAATGKRVPDHRSPDPSVAIPGRNLLLLAKAVVYASLHRLDSLALGILRGNPFPDATPEFLTTFEGITPFAVGTRVRIQTPYSQLNKLQVIRKGKDLPLHLTLSCLAPSAGGVHCGRCNKCAERRRAFQQAQVEDLTEYAPA